MLRNDYGEGITPALFRVIRDGAWHPTNELYGQVVKTIPTHQAMRTAVRVNGGNKTADDFTLDEANWIHFKEQIRHMPVEFDVLGPRRAILASSQVRLKPEGTCDCGSPAYRSKPYSAAVLKCSSCGREFLNKEDRPKNVLNEDVDPRAVLNGLRAVEAKTPFRLVKLTSGEWAFRAPTIK